MYREQYGEYAYWCLGEEEEEDLYLFRVSHSDALSTAINRGPDKKLKWYELHNRAEILLLQVNPRKS